MFVKTKQKIYNMPLITEFSKLTKRKTFNQKSVKRCVSTSLCFPINERIYNEARPPYQRHYYQDSSKNHDAHLKEKLQTKRDKSYRRDSLQLIEPLETRKMRFENRKTSNYKRTDVGLRNSLKSNVSLAQRLLKYQQQTRKPIKKSLIKRSGYEEKVPIGERIAMIEDKLTYKPPEIRKYLHHVEEPLRVATPERAKELMDRHFGSAKPTRPDQPPQSNQPTRKYYGPTARFYGEGWGK